MILERRDMWPAGLSGYVVRPFLGGELKRVEEPGTHGNMSELAVRVREHGLINDRTLTAIEGLGVMHMLTLLGGGDVDMTKAREYIRLTEGVLFALQAQA